jgi:hypothetical protein
MNERAAGPQVDKIVGATAGKFDDLTDVAKRLRRLRLQAADGDLVALIESGLAGDVEQVARTDRLGQAVRLYQRSHVLAGDRLELGHGVSSLQRNWTGQSVYAIASRLPRRCWARIVHHGFE